MVKYTFGIILGVVIGFGQHCDIDNISQSLSATPFSTEGGVGLLGTSTAKVDDNSVIITYDYYFYGQRPGKFVVVNSSGEITLGPIIFHDDITTGPSVIRLDSNSVFILYRDDGDDGKGKYVIYNYVNGEEELPETGFSEGTTTNVFVSAGVNESTVLISYRDDTNGGQGKFIVINPLTEEIIVQETIFSDSINVVSVSSINNTRALIVYSEAYPSNESYFFVINPQTGEEILSQVRLPDSGPFSSIKIDTTYSFISHTSYENPSSKAFIVVNTITGEQSASTIFTNSMRGGSFSVSMIDDNSIVMSYSSANSPPVGKYSVYNINGNVELAESSINNEESASCTSVISLGCSFLITYFNDDDGYGKFVVYSPQILDVDGEFSAPDVYSLDQNYPNPFNPITTLKYDLPEDSFVDITVYDMLGNMVNNLINKNQSSGSKSVQWDATNNQGELVSAGVYLYKIQAGDFSQTKKMILLK